MFERKPRATSVTAGTLILGLTALFAAIGVDLARNALDPSSIDRETYLSAVGLGLNEDATRNLMGITAIVVLGLCALTTVLCIGVLARREGVRHAAIGTFVAFAGVTLPLSVAGILSDDPAPSAAVGLAIGVMDAVVVVLLLHPQTVADFQRAEAARQRLRSDRRARRTARASARDST